MAGNRPVYPVIFIDCVNVKIRDGQVANRPIYVALAVTLDGPGTSSGSGRRARRRRGCEVLAAGADRDQEPRRGRLLHRRVRRLKGLPDAVGAVWPQTVVQTCVVHLLRNSFRYASRKNWSQIAKDLKPIYTAPSEAAALDRFAEFAGKWEKRYPAIIGLWTNAWAEFVPFLQFDNEIRTVICTTNAIESINARIRRAVNARGHFPTEQAALKCIYLAVMSLDPTGKGRKRWSNRWKAALNAFEITFDGRLSAGRN
jgi:putative transposase